MKKNHAAKTVAFLLSALLCFFCAVAETDGYPPYDAHRRDALPEDFAGAWSALRIRSDEAVDLGSYAYAELYNDGTAEASFGGSEDEVFFSGPLQQAGDGCCYIPGEDGGGMYCFLYENGLMGCAETIEDPETIWYMEYCGPVQSEAELQAIAAEAVLEKLGPLRADAQPEDYEGEWRGSRVIDGDTEYGFIMAGIDFSLSVSGDTARVCYTIADETTAYETSVRYAQGYAAVADEYGESEEYLRLLQNGDLALISDIDLPESAIVFCTPEKWDAQAAELPYDPDPQPDTQDTIESFEDVCGEWLCTHISVEGALYPTASMGMHGTIAIGPEGGIEFSEDGEGSYAGGTIENGSIFVSEEYGIEGRLYLYNEGELLLFTEEPDDFSMVLIYQRIPEDSGE